MGRTAMACLSATAHNLAAYSQSELGFATHFNMYPEVQLPSPNGSLGHTQGQVCNKVNCAMARSKALINAVMSVYLFDLFLLPFSHKTFLAECFLSKVPKWFS
jgi:hypothetical protein